MKSLLACGDLYFSRIVNGVYQGFVKVGIASSMAVKPNSTLKEQISKSCANYGQVEESVAIPAPTEITISVGDLNKQNLAIQFLGTSIDNLVTAGTVTSAPFTVQKLGNVAVLPHKNISNLAVKDTGASITYTLGTDYELNNATAGLITPLVGGAITDNQVLEVSYDYTAMKSATIKGGTESQIKVGIMLVGKNLVDGKGLTLNVWRTTLAPTSAVDFLSDDFVKMELSGKAEIVDGKDEPFSVEIDIEAL